MIYIFTLHGTTTMTFKLGCSDNDLSNDLWDKNKKDMAGKFNRTLISVAAMNLRGVRQFLRQILKQSKNGQVFEQFSSSIWISCYS